MELWQQCAEWLSKHNVIPNDHNILKADATLINFANLLRDGVLLCKLLNKIEPGSISNEKITLRPQLAQILCIRNITNFIECCNNKFGISPQNSFEPYMLFDYIDIIRVLLMLSELSKSELSRRTGIWGFPPGDCQIVELYTKRNYTNFKNYAKKDREYDQFGLYEVKSESENIYDEIYVNNKLSDAEVQKYYETPTARHYSIMELFNTERMYVDNLRTLKEVCMERLKSHMEPDDFTIIFKYIDILYEMHGRFLEELEQFVKGYVELSQVLVDFRDDLTTYGDFCVNLPLAQKRLQDACQKSSRVKQMVSISESCMNNGQFKLREMLAIPFQRFLKYKLLVEWSNDAVMEFLDLYEGEPAIWNPNNPQHKDRNEVYFS